MTVDIPTVCARWRDPKRRPLFKGQLISEDGCKCAQGDVLSLCGVSDDELRRMDQSKADRLTAEKLGISRAHAVLLRRVNDGGPGAPEDVLEHPEKYLGKQAPRILAFWKLLDRMTAEDWKAFMDRRAAAGAAAGAAAWAAAGDAAWAAAGAAAGDAGYASWEIQGESLAQFFFLPLFGIARPEDIKVD